MQGWVVANRKNPTPKADAFCPSQEGILEIHSDSLSIAVSGSSKRHWQCGIVVPRIKVVWGRV